MMYRTREILTAALLVASTFAWAAPSLAYDSDRGVTYTFATPQFQDIVVDGDIDVEISTGTQQNVSVQGYGAEPAIVWVDQGALHVSGTNPIAPGAPYPPLVRITVTTLNNLVVNGATRINAHGSFSAPLDIDALGSGSIQIAGQVNLAHLQQLAHSSLSIEGINSNELHVKATNLGKMDLSGDVSRLYIEAANGSDVNTRRLRGKEEWISSNDNAVVKVCASSILRAFAAKTSRIEYFRYPASLAPTATESGTIVQMGWSCP